VYIRLYTPQRYEYQTNPLKLSEPNLQQMAKIYILRELYFLDRISYGHSLNDLSGYNGTIIVFTQNETKK
jgi:hypothetical protein